MPQATTKAPVATQSQAPANIPPAQPTITQFAVPRNQLDVEALQSTRSELSTQLNSARGRRDELSSRLPNATPGPDKTGMESRITQLDGRIVQIESDMAAVGRALSAAPSYLRQTTSTGVPRNFGQPNASQVTAISIISILAIGLPLSIGIMRLALRRAGRAPAPQMPKEITDRLERMEQGIDAMAVELERIGEGQRFVTQLMSDRAKRAALPEGVPRT